jgi:hypothetical protein
VRRIRERSEAVRRAVFERNALLDIACVRSGHCGTTTSNEVIIDPASLP